MRPLSRGREMQFAETLGNMAEAGTHRVKTLVTSWLLAALVVGCSLTASAQAPADDKNAPAPSSKSETPSPEFSPDPIPLKSLPRNLFQDQKDFWTTPFRLTKAQWRWVVPASFAGAGLLAIDTAAERHVPTSPTTVSHASTASNAGVAALVGVGGGMFVWGHLTHD